MVFVYKKWNEFCRSLKDANIISIPACDVSSDLEKFVVLKHDVETDVQKAYNLAKIEAKYGHRGSYYVQAYLMGKKKNIELLTEMQNMGHEISYHYDVMDSNKGNIDLAISEFEKNRTVFENLGFEIKTVCQHGNPVIERIGYTSNRDFFRSTRVRELYPNISDIMVNFKEHTGVDYVYYSDAGRKFKMIFDPINNDVINSDDKNVPYEDLNGLLSALENVKCAIVSTHPHRWTKSAFAYSIKSAAFKVIKGTAKLMMKIPFMKKFMGRFYYLAKKI